MTHAVHDWLKQRALQENKDDLLMTLRWHIPGDSDRKPAQCKRAEYHNMAHRDHC